MSKDKNNNIEEIITKITLNDKVNYLIKYKDEKYHKLVEEDNLSTSEKKYCENYYLNKKRRENNILEKTKSSKFTNKIKKDKDDDDDDEDDDENNNNNNNNNLSISSYNSLSNKKETKKKKNKNKIKKEENKENKDKNKNKDKDKDKDKDKGKDKEIFKERNKINKSENKYELKTKIFEREGILLEDKPVEIINVGYKNRNDKNLYSLVKWKQNDSIRILDSIIENTKIRKVCPELLIDFYESKILFLDDK